MILEISAGGVKFQGEEHVCRLEHLRYLVINEADRMVEKGHFQELSSILELIHRKRYLPHLNICIFAMDFNFHRSLNFFQASLSEINDFHDCQPVN